MRYLAPQTIDEAVTALHTEAGSSYVLAGGTDVLVRLRLGHINPDLVVDIKRIPGISGIKQEADGGFRIGAATCGAEMREHAALGKAWPGVVEAMDLIGSTQIQGRATLAGNLCNASPAADSVPAMVAADALVRVVGANGSREVPVADIPTAPGRTSLAKGELIDSVYLPPRAPSAGDAYLRFIPRTEMDIAVVGVGISLKLDKNGVIESARVSLGAVAATVLLVKEAAEALISSKLEENALEALASACSAACKPIDDKRGTIEFRTDVAGVLAKRAARIAYDRARAA